MNEASMSSLDAQILRFRLMNNHARGCNSLAPQPKQEGFQYDYYVTMHCDCFLSLKNPTFDEKVKFVRHMAQHFGGVHSQACNTSNPLYDTYRKKRVNVIRNCTCWLSEVDKPLEPAYTDPMTPEANPVVDQIKQEIRKIRANALGPHLDTPIYDQLAREYDKKFNTMNYFETDLGKRITHLSQFVRKHRA